MPRIIFKCPYIRGGTGHGSAHLGYYVRYIATREGAEYVNFGTAVLPATEKQRVMVEQLLQDFPLSRGMFEYEDYAASPTRGNATEFIARALEDNYNRVAKKENYISYIAQRPRAERIGTHALFTGEDDPLVLSQVADAVAKHSGNVWLPIISLRREDAARLGYDNAEQWKNLLSAHAMEIAQAMKIPWEHFRWYAAFHNEGTHPHVHMVCYSTEPKEGFLTKTGIAEIKSNLVKQIFRQELTELYSQQTQHRDELIQEAGETMARLIQQMQSGTLENTQIEQLMGYLSERLKYLSGKKQYGYLKAPLKSVVDKIVNELAKDERVAAAYEQWYILRENVLRTYKENLPERLLLSQQKEFKRIKNLIIEEAMRLGEFTTVFHDENMVDETEEFDTETTRNDRTIWQMASEYRACKEVLYEETASPDAKQEALNALERLYLSDFPIAAHLLGKVYRDGVFVPADEAVAELWFQKSTEDGNDCSEYALGKLLLKQKRSTEAVDWLRKAVRQENQFAQYWLGKVLLQGEDAPKDVDEAVCLLTLSANQGNQYAQYTLGKLHLLGKEIPRDRETAIYWFTRSAAQGNKYAQYVLDHINDFHDVSGFSCATRLLRYMSNIFREQTPATSYQGIHFTDKKMMQKIREKKMAMGHKVDDHEQEITM